VYGVNTVANYQPGNYTGTLNASAWLNSIGAAGSLAQASGAAQPIIVSSDYVKKAYFPGVVGNYLSTPDSAALHITGDMEIQLDWAPTAAQNRPINSWAGASQRWLIILTPTCAPGDPASFQWVDSGNTARSISFSFTRLTTRHILKWTFAVATGTLILYQSTDDGVTWAEISTPAAFGATSIRAGNNPLNIGLDTTAGQPVTGSIYRATVYNGIGGTLAADFNASDWSETSTNGATQVSSTTGETWTLNNTGANLAQIIASPQLLADGAAHKMASAAFGLVQPVYGWAVVKPITYTTGDWLLSGTTGAAGIVATTGTPKISVNAGSSAAENTGATLNAWHIIEYCINGASSYISVDGAAQTTGDAGAGNPDGFGLFSDNAGANYGNYQVKEWVIRTAAQARVTPLLRSLHGTP
jgi:hypothetical protein